MLPRLELMPAVPALPGPDYPAGKPPGHRRSLEIDAPAPPADKPLGLGPAFRMDFAQGQRLASIAGDLPRRFRGGFGLGLFRFPRGEWEAPLAAGGPALRLLILEAAGYGEPGVGDAIRGLMDLLCADCAGAYAESMREVAEFICHGRASVKQQAAFRPERLVQRRPPWRM